MGILTDGCMRLVSTALQAANPGFERDHEIKVEAGGNHEEASRRYR